MTPTSDELLPCPFCGGMAHVRRKIAYRMTGRKATVLDFHPGMPEFGIHEGEVENEVDVLDWAFGFQVWCGRCKAKTPYKFGPWHAYTNDEIEELGREDFHRHAPESEDEPAKLAAIDVWNRRANMTPTSDERREVAERLRHTRGIREFVDALGIDLDSDWCWTDVSRRVADLIDPPEITEDTSDGYHTFGQLYYQRMMLFAVLVQEHKDCAWKTWNHEDGEPCFGGGWFLVTIDTPRGAYGYHFDAKYWRLFDCPELPKAKHWDGYTEEDVNRLFSLIRYEVSGDAQ